MPDLAARARTLLDLHRAPEILVLTNVWDVVSARVVAGTDGVRALATASHSIAATFGYEDGENIPLELHLSMVERSPAAVDRRATMDSEAGYGAAGEPARRAVTASSGGFIWSSRLPPTTPAAIARRAIAAGVVGGNLEDQMKPLDEAVTARRAGSPAAPYPASESIVARRSTAAGLRSTMLRCSSSGMFSPSS